MNGAEDKSIALFDSGYFCAESVLIALAEEMGIESEFLPALATGFCGGMARTSGTCGAITGAMLALNIAFGRKSHLDSAEENYWVVQELIERFTKKFSSTNCRDLTGCDLGSKAGQKLFIKNNCKELCREYTGFAAATASDILKNR